MKSIKIISEDRPGLIADVSEVLAEHNINIDDLEGKTFEHQAVIEIIVENPNDAVMALRSRGYKVVSNDLLTIRIKDEPGASAKITRDLNNAKLSIRGISTLDRKDGYCYVALSTDNDDAARKLLKDLLV